MTYLFSPYIVHKICIFVLIGRFRKQNLVSTTGITQQGQHSVTAPV